MTNVLITGTSSGIGLATAVELARRGARVFASMRDLERADDLLREADRAGVALDLVQLDVTDSASVENAVATVLAAAGSIEVVVNNAGVAPAGILEYTTDEELRLAFETNVFGPFRVARACLPSMRARRSGRIVNISSGGANPRAGIRLMGVYAATKAALNAMTLEFAKEVAPLGIDVVLMERGVGADTRMIAALRDQGSAGAGDDAPYRAQKIIFSRQFPAMAETTKPATLIADACLMTAPPLRHPAEWTEPAQPDDATFLRLARLEQDEALYEGLSGMWILQKRLLASGRIAAPAGGEAGSG